MTESVLLICNEFPAPSETFISFQVEDLLERGFAVGVAAGGPVSVTDSHMRDVLAHPRLRLFQHPLIPANKLARGLGCGLRMAVAPILRPSLAAYPTDFTKYRVSFHSGRLGYLSYLNGAPDELAAYSLHHAHFGSSAEELLFWRSKGRIPVRPLVVSFHGCDISQNPKKHGLHVFQSIFEQASVITANSNYTKGRLLLMGAPEEKIVILRATVDVEGCVFRSRSMDTHESLKLVSIGRLDEMKGQRYLIEAVSRLRNCGEKVELRIAGDGPFHARLSKQIADLGLDQYVRLLGWQDRDQIRNLLDWGHVLVAPSITASNGDTEGQGVVLQEAQASGLPVIATTHNGFPDSIVPDKSGILVPEHSVEGIVDAVLKLKAAHLSWPEMGQTGRDFVLNHFTRELLLSRLLDIYERAMTSPPSSSPCAAS